MTPIEGIYFRSRIIHGDLITADTELNGQLGPSGTWFSFVKIAFIALANLADLEGGMRPLYRDHPDMTEAMKALDADLRFAKYIRNVFVGHINDPCL